MKVVTTTRTTSSVPWSGLRRRQKGRGEEGEKGKGSGARAEQGRGRARAGEHQFLDSALQATGKLKFWAFWDEAKMTTLSYLFMGF